MTTLYAAIGISILSLIYAGFNTYRVLKNDRGSEKMIDIAKSIQDGAMAYMNRQFKTIAI